MNLTLISDYELEIENPRRKKGVSSVVARLGPRETDRERRYEEASSFCMDGFYQVFFFLLFLAL